MKKLKQISFLSIGLYLIISIIIFSWLFFVKKSLYFPLFPAVFLLFLLLLVISILFIKKALLNLNDNKKKEKFFRKYLIFRYTVFFVTIIFFFLYVFLIKEKVKIFLIVYLIYYLLYLLFQTWLFSTIAEKKKK